MNLEVGVVVLGGLGGNVADSDGPMRPRSEREVRRSGRRAMADGGRWDKSTVALVADCL